MDNLCEDQFEVGDSVTRLRDGVTGIITNINSCEYEVTFGSGLLDFIPIDSFDGEYEYGRH